MADKRLTDRLGKILTQLGSTPERSIPNANDSWADVQATYRFLNNPRVSFNDIISGHRTATLKRMSGARVVLIPQDTTFFNFARQGHREGFGTLVIPESDQHLLHVSAAFTPDRVNLGVVEATLWQRPEKDAGYQRRKVPIQDKESMRWLDHYKRACDIQAAHPDTLVVSIADREGDIHEWFGLADDTALERQAAYIVRAKCNRRLEYDDDEHSTLWEYFQHTKRLGQYTVDVPPRGAQPARTARMNVSAKVVTFVGRSRASKTPVELQVVYAKELQPPHGVKGIEWMLLTNLHVDDFDGARAIIEWYRCRWEIEVFFRVLKGGCQVEKLRLQNTERLENCLAVYLIIAWRLHCITMLARSMPELPCDKVFSRREWHTILLMKDKKKPPKHPPTLYEVTRKLAMLGGFLGRKGDGEPGVKNIWIGFQRLLDYIEAIEMFNSVSSS